MGPLWLASRGPIRKAWHALQPHIVVGQFFHQLVLPREAQTGKNAANAHVCFQNRCRGDSGAQLDGG